ncbi:homeobox-leucine zipper protein ATHB-52-like [Nicotiana sylvestris]|uniref:Homeobox-leucine zipper protein n=2 Tax=Nicotiana TaxID=4085 RepID=A0A1S3XXD7_TOBAC|nr:PREDICTED: homeobox-leucine zipper protein ATHB-52-like [Nicotiana sylvestris]XP_016444534.1 PREDICTED: homeobox-leucine zipper protein ATHB-52-like [Nicotiana tabacum]
MNSQNLQKYQSLPNHNKKRLNQEQIKLLESSFDSTKKLEPEKKLQLARELGIPPRQISIWYQNRRARWKNQNLEIDYNALQLKLETALSEKLQLEKETERLRGELQKVNQMLIALNGESAINFPSCDVSLSSCCEERGSSSFQDVISYSTTWVHAHEANNLQFNELYALIGLEEGSNNCRSAW